jgi:hypothetical protein
MPESLRANVQEPPLSDQTYPHEKPALSMLQRSSNLDFNRMFMGVPEGIAASEPDARASRSLSKVY